MIFFLLVHNLSGARTMEIGPLRNQNLIFWEFCFDSGTTLAFSGRHETEDIRVARKSNFLQVF